MLQIVNGIFDGTATLSFLIIPKSMERNYESFSRWFFQVNLQSIKIYNDQPAEEWSCLNCLDFLVNVSIRTKHCLRFLWVYRQFIAVQPLRNPA